MTDRYEERAREKLNRLVWQGFPETDHPEAEQILLDHEEHLEAEAIIKAALDVVDATVFHDFDSHVCLLCDQRSHKSADNIDHKLDCPVAAFRKATGGDDEQT